LEIVPNSLARLGWADSLRLEDVPAIYTGDFEHNCFRTGIQEFPVFDVSNPFKYAISMSYHNSYSFGRNFYAMPSYYGTLRWIMRSSDIPEIIKYLTDNGISVAYHVHSPAQYWDEKRNFLTQKFPSYTADKIDKMLEEVKSEVFKKMSEVLSGKKNAGKFITTVDFVDPISNQVMSWKVEAIDQKIKDFISSQLEISKEATSATTSGLGLHPSLSNIVVGGQLSSGGQMLYALKLYLASDTSIAEEVIFENINQAIAANFPNTKYKLGFYHSIVKTEDAVSPDNRVKNSI
jgi:hypothetical protein